MSNNTIRIRAKRLSESTEVKILITHPMETGQRKNDKTGALIPAHFITELTCYHKDQRVLNADCGTAISANPYFSFRIPGGTAGDRVRVAWLDNLGTRDEAETRIE